MIKPGQFAEVIYSDIPIKALLKHFQSLSRPGYPLEFYGALRDCELIDSIRGSTGDLPAFIFFRSLARQLIISISGTATLLHCLYDLRVMKAPHPSGIGAVHSGFLALYGGIKVRLLQQIQEALAKHSPVELILTGHSMGGSLAYLLLLDLLTEELPKEYSILSRVRVRIATYGAPRTGDRQLVDYFHSVIQEYQSKFRLGETFLAEYAVQGFNDGMCPQDCPTPAHVNMPSVSEGIPASPPAFWGYRHFCRVPLYSAGGRLYRPPAPSESQVMFFPPEDKMRIFPMGGHNYYNGRDVELLRRQIGWLTSADIEKPGWESRYEAQTRRDSSYQ